MTYDNVGTYGFSETQELSDVPDEAYNGWRVLSVEGKGENAYVKLITAGVPMNYYHKNKEIAENETTSVENLTTQFFNIPIENTKVAGSFYQSGFKNSRGQTITNMDDLKNLFCNNWTETYQENESAVFTDKFSGKTFTNNNVQGYPKVQSMTIEEIETAAKAVNSIEYIDSGYDQPFFYTNNDLFAIPSGSKVQNEFCHSWIAACVMDEGMASWIMDNLCGVYAEGENRVLIAGGAMATEAIFGIRPVVTLKAKTKFVPAENKVNDTTTWDLVSV